MTDLDTTEQERIWLTGSDDHANPNLHCSRCGVRLTDCGPRCRDYVTPGAS